MALPLFDQRYAFSWIRFKLLKVPAANRRKNADGWALLEGTEQGRRFLQDPEAVAEEAMLLALQRRCGSQLTLDVSVSRLPEFLQSRLKALPNLISGKKRKTLLGLDGHDAAERIRSRGFATVRDLCQLFGGMRRQWIARCDEGRFKGARQARFQGQLTWHVPIAAVDDLTAMYRLSLSRVEAAARLRIAPFQITGLQTLGVLRRLFSGCSEFLERYLIRDVDEVVELLEALSLPCDEASQLGTLRRLSDVYAFEKKWQNAQTWTLHMERVFSGVDPVVQVASTTFFGFQSFATIAPNERLSKNFVAPI
jgi:hypothetical protein